MEIISAENGLRRGERGLKVIMMRELPSNALLADKFLEHFDGFSIGSTRHDPVDPGAGSGLWAHRPPVRRAQRGGQGAAGHGHRRRPQGRQVRRSAARGRPITRTSPPWLVEQGIDSVSLNPGYRGRHLALSAESSTGPAKPVPAFDLRGAAMAPFLSAPPFLQGECARRSAPITGRSP